MRNWIVNIFVFLLALMTLTACGAANPVLEPPAKITIVPEKNFNDQIREWAIDLGANPDSEETQQTLQELNQGACCTRSETLKIYLPFVLQKDVTLFTSIDQLRLGNEEFFHSYECLTRGASQLRVCEIDSTKSFVELHVENMVSRYNAMVEQANFARARIISVAKILDFEIPPVAELSVSIQDAFSADINRAIVEAVAADDTAFQGKPIPQIDSALLQAVSLQMQGETAPLSFFLFAITDLDGRRGRGDLELVPAETNPLVVRVSITLVP